MSKKYTFKLITRIKDSSLIKQLKTQIKNQFDLIDNSKLKRNFLNALPFWVGAFITGLAAVFYAKLFVFVESINVYIYHKQKWLFLFITPVAFLLAWWIPKKYSTFSRGSGIPQVTAAIELSTQKHNYKVDKLLSVKIIIVKVASSIIMLFGGGIIGREGPTIQISAAIFKKINDILPAWYPKISKQNMIVTGAAAGLASAFNTPLGGIVFAIEELTKTHFNYFKSALLTGVIIAGLTALSLSGSYLYLGYPQTSNISVWIILVVIPVAVATGLLASGMGKIILFLFSWKKTFLKTSKLVLYTLICGLILALLAILVDSAAFGSGKHIITTSLLTDQKYLSWDIPFLRIIGTIISFSIGAAGGIFAPSLSAGASVGATVAGWLHLSISETNLIILCGMTGFLTGITRSPFTSSILVIEMTNDHSIIFYLMLTALLANLVSNLISRHSFYEHLKVQYIHDIHQSEVQEKPKIEEEENNR